MNSKKVTWRSVCIAVCALLLWLSPWGCSPLQAQTFNREYDTYFRWYAAKYLYGLLPDDDYRWFVAQCMQESGLGLDPDAESSAGAVGICQIMPESGKDFGLDPDDRTDPEKNIRAAARLLRRNIRIWWPRETRFQNLQLGWAGYNAGAFWILKAADRCQPGAILNWPEIAPCLYYYTGFNNSGQTIHYVAIIPTWYRNLVGQDDAAQ